MMGQFAPPMQGMQTEYYFTKGKTLYSKAVSAYNHNRYLKVSPTKANQKLPAPVSGTPGAIVKSFGDKRQPNYQYTGYLQVPKGEKYPEATGQISWVLFRLYGTAQDIERELRNPKLGLPDQMIRDLLDNHTITRNNWKNNADLVSRYQQSEAAAKHGREARGDFIRTLGSLLATSSIAEQLTQQRFVLGGGRRTARTRSEVTDFDKARASGGLVKLVRKALEMGDRYVDVSGMKRGVDGKGAKAKTVKREKAVLSQEEMLRLQSGQPAGRTKVGVLNVPDFPLISNDDTRWKAALNLLAQVAHLQDGSPNPIWASLADFRGKAVPNPERYTRQALYNSLPMVATKKKPAAAATQFQLVPGNAMPTFTQQPQQQFAPTQFQQPTQLQFQPQQQFAPTQFQPQQTQFQQPTQFQPQQQFAPTQLQPQQTQFQPQQQFAPTQLQPQQTQFAPAQLQPQQTQFAPAQLLPVTVVPTATQSPRAQFTQPATQLQLQPTGTTPLQQALAAQTGVQPTGNTPLQLGAETAIASRLGGPRPTSLTPTQTVVGLTTPSRLPQ